MDEFVPARRLAEAAPWPCPDDAAERAAAATALLAEGVELRRRVERVATLPMSGESP